MCNHAIYLFIWLVLTATKNIYIYLEAMFRCDTSWTHGRTNPECLYSVPLASLFIHGKIRWNATRFKELTSYSSVYIKKNCFVFMLFKFLFDGKPLWAWTRLGLTGWEPLDCTGIGAWLLSWWSLFNPCEPTRTSQGSAIQSSESSQELLFFQWIARS